MHSSSTLPAFVRGSSPEGPRWADGQHSNHLPRGFGRHEWAVCLLEALAMPGCEPPPHVHSREDELFYVLEGELDVFAGDEVFTAGAGGCVFLPRLKPHAFVIRSSSLRMLALFTPGGIEEKFRSVSAPGQGSRASR